MDAGVFEGKRYVLPLRYNMPVLLTNPGDPRLMRSDDLTLLDVADQAIAADDPVLSIPLSSSFRCRHACAFLNAISAFT